MSKVREAIQKEMGTFVEPQEVEAPVSEAATEGVSSESAVNEAAEDADTSGTQESSEAEVSSDITSEDDINHGNNEDDEEGSEEVTEGDSNDDIESDGDAFAFSEEDFFSESTPSTGSEATESDSDAPATANLSADIIGDIASRLSLEGVSSIDDIVNAVEGRVQSASLISPEIDSAIKEGLIKFDEIGSEVLTGSVSDYVNTEKGYNEVLGEALRKLYPNASSEEIQQHIEESPDILLRQLAQSHASDLDQKRQNVLAKAIDIKKTREAALQESRKAEVERANKFSADVSKAVAEMSEVHGYKVSAKDRTLVGKLLTTEGGLEKLIFGKNPSAKTAVERVALLLLGDNIIKQAEVKSANNQKKRIIEGAQNRSSSGMSQGTGVPVNQGTMNATRQRIQKEMNQR